MGEGAGRFATVVLSLVAAALGFFLAAGGSAFRTRDYLAEPWRKLHVEQEGQDGVPSHTRVVFEDPSLPVQAIDIARNAEGLAESALVSKTDGSELRLRYDEQGRPSALLASDGSSAELSYEASRITVRFEDGSRQDLGQKRVLVPTALRPAFKMSALEAGVVGQGAPQVLGRLFQELSQLVLPSAHAEASFAVEDTVTVRREVPLTLILSLAAGATLDSGGADLEFACAPFVCLAASPTKPRAGENSLRIAVVGKRERARLGPEPGDERLAGYREQALAERKLAQRLLPLSHAVIGAVSVTASACESLRLDKGVCVAGLAAGATAGAAVHALRGHVVVRDGPATTARVRALADEERARVALDREAEIEVCVSGPGLTRACSKQNGRPFAATGMAAFSVVANLRRGLGEAINGSFELLQADGADCKFSPSPKTTGTLRLSFDSEQGRISAVLKASDQRGTRSNLSCSLGTANMSWQQSYAMNLSQSLSEKQLSAGGSLPLKLTGTMSGSGSYSFSNCRASSGAGGQCPPGKNDGYSYGVELVGTLDLEARTGDGRLVISGAPLGTSGTWRAPAKGGP